MKCPYNGFRECIVEKCPSCNYEVEKTYITEGIFPSWMNRQMAIDQGYAWESQKKSYKFISCKLIDNNIQPINVVNKTTNNISSTKTNVIIRKSIF